LKTLEMIAEASPQDAIEWNIGISPHAPFSITPEAIKNIAGISREKNILLAMHLAESPEEMQFLADGSGPFRIFLEELGAWDGSLDFHGKRPMDYLRLLSEASRALIIHGNYLDDAEIAFLADQGNRIAVVYCPRTHAHFGHAAYPLEKMVASGVRVALGTDSRPSSPDLNLWADMREIVRRHPAVSKKTLLELGTKNGANALGLDEEVGSLEPGKWANFAIFALPDNPLFTDPYEALFSRETTLQAVWLRGKTI
jgi:aminodeoxyfutalosine deaminase